MHDLSPMMPVTRAEAAVLFERQYQRRAFRSRSDDDYGHNDNHYKNNELVCAAMHYAATAIDEVLHEIRWPWLPQRKPKFFRLAFKESKRRNLEKAAALILAELDRMDDEREELEVERQEQQRQLP